MVRLLIQFICFMQSKLKQFGFLHFLKESVLSRILYYSSPEFIAVFLIPAFRESLERLSMFKKMERKPIPWSCELTIGPNLSIRIVAYKSVSV